MDVKDVMNNLVEGDMVLLTSFFQPSYDNPILKEQTSSLSNFVNMKSKNTKDNYRYIHNVTEFGIFYK